MNKLPLKVKLKLNELIARIETGIFSAADIDNVLIQLRSFANHKKIFLETAHFAAHPEARTKGMSQDSMAGFIDNLKFHFEIVEKGEVVQARSPFPLYIHRVLVYRIKNMEEKVLKKNFSIGRAPLLNYLENSFLFDKAGRTCVLRDKVIVNRLVADAINDIILSFTISPIFHIDSFFIELVSLLKYYQIKTNQLAFLAQKDKILLAVLCLINGTEVSLPDGIKARLIFHAEDYQNGNFGPIEIWANINADFFPKSGITISYRLIASNLDPYAYCDSSLFETGNLERTGEAKSRQVKKIDFTPDIILNNSFKLIKAVDC